VLLNMDCEAISEILGPHAKTIREWAADGDWHVQRKLKNSSHLSVGLHALWQINLIYERAKEEGRMTTPAEVDMASKHHKMMEGLNKDLAFVSSAIDAMGLFMDMLREKDKELFDAVAQYSMDFTQELAQKFGDL